jgi:2-C-methyl-D-erythritol 4-phosphate cytidylyltransferase
MAAVIVLAAGSGTRVDQEFNKVFLPLVARPVLGYSLTTMDRSPAVDRIVLVVRPVDWERGELLVAGLALSKPCLLERGGSTRQESELAGLLALAGVIEQGLIDVVAIHDGARPFASGRLVAEVVATARRYGGAIPALPVVEQLYETGPDRVRPLAATGLVRAQTPQAFWAAPLLEAYRKAAVEGFSGSDTAETVERYSSLEVRIVPGEARNLKITFPEDLIEAEDLAVHWGDGGWAG